MIYVVVPVKRRWTSINPWKRGWERGDGERILRPESTARMNARKNRVLIILRCHHPSCASWTICKSDVDVRLRFIELEEYFYIKIFAFDSSSKMEDPDVYYFQGWTRNFVKILHRLADYLRCLWYRVLPKLEGAWIFSFSPFFFFFFRWPIAWQTVGLPNDRGVDARAWLAEIHFTRFTCHGNCVSAPRIYVYP